MPSRGLTGVWAAVDFCLLVSGLILIIFSQLWAGKHLMNNFIISKMSLRAGLALGIMFEITFFVSVFAVTQRRPLTSGFKILNWALIADSAACIIIGSIMWVQTLQERAHYEKVWIASAVEVRTQLQDKFTCCGWFNGTNIAIGGTVCHDNATAAALPGCVTPIIPKINVVVDNIFTTIYGFIAITLTLFLASLCLINRREEERFRRIDEKRGGRGFV
ncbi:tetraspanin [Cantharellus anzutake]|uniref:tetraspanin n=1 Tax=Cantharellus anzutake TaxID=1750568 RepID=UPI001908B448|nr:tetraspanin [Cantharellus anzutake]KAF8337620.1 tetraspanin [Cantharellus anzutake]